MARKKDNTMILVLVGAAVFMFMNRRQQQVQSYPPAPTNYAGSPEWINWARQIITLAGGLTQTLFGPGGPFAGKDPADVVAATGNEFYA